MLVEDRALILQGFAYGDTSRILRLLCETHGNRTVIAKGALRPGNRFGGVLEPFTEGVVRFRLREGRDMHTLSGFDLLRSRQGLGRNLVAFSGASLAAELALRFGTTEADPELFRRVSDGMDSLMAAGSDEAAAGVALGVVWRLIALLGFEPQLELCVGCGREVEAAEATRFDMEAGGVACTRCRPSGRVVDAGTRLDIAWMCAGDGVRGGGDWLLHGALLRAFVATHLSQEHPLRSLSLFGGMLPRGPGGPEGSVVQRV